MSDEELLGQTLLLGYLGYSPDRNFLSWIRDRYIGGVKIFGWNVRDTTTLAAGIGRMQEEAAKTPLKIPLIVATDQEGGWVRHVRDTTSDTPGNMALGASRLPQDSYLTGYYIGLELKALGINMNFAPTVDVYANPQAHVIGPRAFSSDPVQAAVLGTAYYLGLKDAGIIATAKHFPGHGNADEDSHGTLPLIHDSLEVLWNRDLVPYRMMIPEGIPAIMTGHLGFPGIIDERTPSSLSYFFQTELLKNRLGFQGIVMTDDLHMVGAHQRTEDVAEVCAEAMMAGNDFILISRFPETHERVWNTMMKQLKNDPAFRSRLKDAAYRVLKIKLEYLKRSDGVPLYPDTEHLANLVPTPEGKDFFFEQSFRSVTVIRDSALPLSISPDERILLAGQFQEFFSVGKTYFPQADTFDFSYSPFYYPVPAEKRSLTAMAGNYDTIIFCLANPNSLEHLKALESFDARIIVLSTLTPIYLQEVPWVPGAVAVYGTGIDSFTAGFAALSGMFHPEGTLPVEFTGPLP
ncbi:MAG: glycoside hydrolase family 3 protein [Spirochaetales bacterium]|nr:glycoside hydrolase family 3 protein [Spirochaetales bacterium]